MKKISVLFLAVFLLTALAFGKELSGADLEAVNKALDAKLYVNDYEELSDQLSYLDKIEKQISDLGSTISEEARFICDKIIVSQRESSKSADANKLENIPGSKKPKKDKAAEAEAEAAANSYLEEFKNFESKHSDLSSHFYFRYKEAEMATLAYLPTAKQLKAMMGIFEDYKIIYETNPDYGEILYTYGMMLYMVPKIAGGDKDGGMEKILRATQVSQSNYEKAAALLLYSQILLEDKKKDDSKLYLATAFALDPDNKTYTEIIEMNEAGYSMFKMAEYQKKKNKK